MAHSFAKYSDLPAAAQTFPKPVFQEWLKLRRQAADLLFPGWRGYKYKMRRVAALDLGARIVARCN